MEGLFVDLSDMLIESSVVLSRRSITSLYDESDQDLHWIAVPAGRRVYPTRKDYLETIIPHLEMVCDRKPDADRCPSPVQGRLQSRAVDRQASTNLSIGGVSSRRTMVCSTRSALPAQCGDAHTSTVQCIGSIPSEPTASSGNHRDQVAGKCPVNVLPGSDHQDSGSRIAVCQADRSSRSIVRIISHC